MPVGRVIAVAPDHITVSVDPSKICARCAAGKGCGAGFLAGSNRARLIDVMATPGMKLQPGDEVELTLAPTHLLHAAFLAYGLPLLGVLVALGVAWVVGESLDDGFAAGLAMAGLGVGFLAGRHFLNKDRCLRNFVPSVSEKNAEAQDL